MTFKECRSLICSDYRRLSRSDAQTCFGWGEFLARIMGNESFMVTFWYRIGSYLSGKNNSLAWIPLLLVKIIFRWNRFLTGIQINLGTDIGPGLKFFHYGSVVIGYTVKIGRNVSIHQGVTIGRVFAGKKAGMPTIGDNVVIFAGAKILGNIHVGHHAVIGANAVVTNDVPDYSVVGGVPAKVISTDSRKCFDEHWAKIFAFYDV